MQVVAPPWRPQLRGVPLPVGRARQPFVPDWKGVVEDVVEEGAFGDDERHGAEDCTAANSARPAMYKEGMRITDEPI